MADFRIRVTVDPRQAVAGIDKTEKRMKRLSRTTDRLRSQFATLLGAGGVLLAFAAVTRTIANFEQTMSTVKGVTRATEAEFAQLTETAKELGATTRFTATQAGEGLIFLSRAGFSVVESIEAVDDTLALAQAGALGLGQAADITSNVLQGFRLEAAEAGRVVDVLAFTANNANTTVAQLGQALSFVAPVAAGLGVTLEETSAAIAALSDAGIQSTRAGTGLVRIMAELESPTEKTKEIFAGLGVSLDEVRVSEVGLEAALRALSDAGIDTGLALEAFGKRGGPAFAVLAASIPKVDEMTEKLEKQTGTAKAMAAVMDDNLNGALLAVKSAAEAVALEFGALGASSVLTTLFRGMAGGLRSLAKNLDTVLKVFKALIITLTVAFAQRAVPAAVAGFNAISKSIVRMTAAIAANPLGALAIAITAVLSLIFVFRDSIKLSSDGVATLGDLVAVAADIIKEGLGGALNFIKGALKAFGALFGGIFDNVEFSIAAVLRGLARLADFLINVFKLKLQLTLTFVQKLPGALKEAFILGLNFVLTAVEGGINKIVAALNNIPGVDIKLVDIPKLKNTAEGAGRELGNALLTNFKDTLKAGAATQFVDRLLTEAEKRAQERAAAAGAPDGTDGGGVPPPKPEPTGGGPAVNIELQVILQQLEQQRELLKMTSQAREVAIELLAIEAELTNDLTKAEKAQVVAQLEGIQALTLQAQILEELRGPQEELIRQQEALDELYRRSKIDLEEYNNETALLAQKTAEADNTIRGGFSAGLLEISNRTKDLGKNVQTFVVGAFDKATDALINFATTGKFEFRSFVADLLQQLAKLALQLALTAALKAALSGTSLGGFLGVGGAPPIPGAQNGLDGTIAGSGGTDSQLVAFRGTPGERVQVTTPGQESGSSQPIIVQAPPVNITNVQSMEDIPLGIESSEGEQAVLNVLSRNTDAIKALVG